MTCSRCRRSGRRRSRRRRKRRHRRRRRRRAVWSACPRIPYGCRWTRHRPCRWSCRCRRHYTRRQPSWSSRRHTRTVSDAGPLSPCPLHSRPFRRRSCCRCRPGRPIPASTRSRCLWARQNAARHPCRSIRACPRRRAPPARGRSCSRAVAGWCSSRRHAPGCRTHRTNSRCSPPPHPRAGSAPGRNRRLRASRPSEPGCPPRSPSRTDESRWRRTTRCRIRRCCTRSLSSHTRLSSPSDGLSYCSSHCCNSKSRCYRVRTPSAACSCNRTGMSIRPHTRRFGRSGPQEG